MFDVVASKLGDLPGVLGFEVPKYYMYCIKAPAKTLL
jgi:hypothetical protein